MDTDPAFSFTSHVAGRNARVDVYSTHINWRSKPVLPVWALLLIMVCTCFISLLFKPLRTFRVSTSSIPMKAVTGVTSQPSRLQAKLTIIAPGTVIEARIAQTEADAIRQYILGRIG